MIRNTILLLSIIISFGFISVENTDTKAVSEIRQDTIHVDGICNSCKGRIENAALIRGVKKVNWNKTTKELVVLYDASKTNLKEIQYSIIEAGYDTQDYKAKLEDYKRLPKCCAYREPGAMTH